MVYRRITAVLFISALSSCIRPANSSAGTYWDLTPTSGTAKVPFTFTKNVSIGGPNPWIDATASPYFAQCDGATDDAAAINAAIAAAPSQGATISLPPGTCVIKSPILQNKTSIIAGKGRDTTKIQVAVAAGDAITTSASRCSVRDLTITSTVTRTGAGLHVTGGSESWFSNLFVTAQSTGIYNAAAGNDFEKIICSSNLNAGFVFDGTSSPQNEVGVRFVQSNANGGDGFYILGPGTGMRFTVVTSANNTGAGLRLVNPDGSSAKALDDVWINSGEFSGNGGASIDASKDGNSVALIIGNNFIEGGTKGVDISTTVVGATISGNTITGASNMGIDTSGSTEVSITGNYIASNTNYGVKLNGTRISMDNNVISNSQGGTQSYGVLFAGANSVSIVGGDMSHNGVAASSQSVPASSMIFGVNGLQNQSLTNQTGLGTAAPTAFAHLGAGTSSASGAPMKFTSGTNLSSPEAGAVEWNGTNLFLTQTSGPTRKTVAYTDSNITGTAANVTGVVAVANGGTSTSTALSGSGAVMVEDGSVIKQGPAGTTTQVLHGNASGTPTYSAVSLANDITGTLSGSNVSGGTFGAVNGSALTSLTAANVTGSHTLPDGVLSTNVPLLNLSNTFSQSQVVSVSGADVGVKVVSDNTFPYFRLDSTFNNSGNRNWAITTDVVVFGDFSIHQSTAAGVDPASNTSGASKFYIDNTGKVGIGTTTPATMLDVNGGAVIRGHHEYVGTAPSVSSCGTTPSGSVVGNDNVGTISVGGGAVTACTLTFNSSWTNAPSCTISDNSTLITGDVSSISVSTVTFSFSASLGGGKIYYICSGYR